MLDDDELDDFFAKKQEPESDEEEEEEEEVKEESEEQNESLELRPDLKEQINDLQKKQAQVIRAQRLKEFAKPQFTADQNLQ